MTERPAGRLAAAPAWQRTASASSRCNCRVKASARERTSSGRTEEVAIGGTFAAVSCTRLPRLYHVERLTPSASHGRCANEGLHFSPSSAKASWCNWQDDGAHALSREIVL